MSRRSRPARPDRWRAAATGVAIALVSVTTSACGGEAAEDGGVLEQEEGEEGEEGEEDD